MSPLGERANDRARPTDEYAVCSTALDVVPIKGFVRMRWDNTVARFLLVGLVNSAFTLLVFAILEAIVHDHLVAAVLAVPICVVFAHAMTGRLVFAMPGFGTLIPYVAVYAALGAINAAIIHVFVLGGFAPIWGQMFAFPVIGVLSYLASKNFVFRRPR